MNTSTPNTYTLSPFQGLVSWRCHNSEGRYRLAVGLRPFRAMIPSPEGALYANDGHRPSDKT
jgi:hypothetical protein